MLPRRKIRRLIIVPCICLAITLYVAIFHKVFNLDSLRPKPTETRKGTTTVTVYERTTATQAAVFDRESDEPLESHTFRSDGYLEVNPNGRHPIYDLMEHAEAEWEEKLKRQSKSLGEAVVEYTRRYHRAPPKGFDDWWSYCQENNVQLPDEYDRIYNDLEPYWGIKPADLRKLQTEHESHADSYTIGKTEDSKVTVVTTGGSPTKEHLSQAQEIIDLLTDIEKFLPPFRAVFSPHDNPNMATDWEAKTQALKAAAARTYVDIDNPPPVQLLGWASGCSPDSLLRSTPFNLDSPPSPPSYKRFIYDHLKVMDPCNHPSILYQHGQFLSHNHGPVPDRVMIPQFSYSSTKLHHDIVPATPINWIDDIWRSDDPDFEDKVDERLLWRGTTTGMWASSNSRWRSQQRMRLVQWANEREGAAFVLRPTESRNERIGKGKLLSKARINPAMMDVTYAEEPHSCDPELCKLIKEEYAFRGRQSLKAAGLYKYVLDIDGNGWSSRFKRLVVSRSVIFKSTVFPEWFQERIQPWVHYVPVGLDLSDLYDSLTFFRGDLNGEGAHEELAYQIALAGRDWARTFWRQEDMTAYNFRLFLEYARVISLDREGMSYKG